LPQGPVVLRRDVCRAELGYKYRDSEPAFAFLTGGASKPAGGFTNPPQVANLPHERLARIGLVGFILIDGVVCNEFGADQIRTERQIMLCTRRDFGKIALASVPLGGARGAANIDSKFYGVQIGAITYSFNSIANPDPEAIIRAYVEIGLGEAELMSNHCEVLAGAPRAARGGGRSAAATPEQLAAMQAQQEQIRNWRASASASTWKSVRNQFNDAGIEVALLCYNMNDNMKDEDIEYGFSMAQGLGVKAITTSTTLTMAKRIAAIADSHKLLVGYHGHDATNDPNQTATLESYETLMAYGKYNGVNLDIGHFTAANYDAVAFIKAHHAKITNLHVKDMKRDHGAYTPFGEGDTPIKGVLQLLKREKYDFPGNIELEYRLPPDSTLIAEMKKCLVYCKDCLA
jgi:sugar phosphate isomerase/epimerase